MKAGWNVFPYKLQEGCGSVTVYMGLNARDYIAIQAMTGLCSNSRLCMYGPEEIAGMAYRMADAMIKQSEVRDE